MEPTANDRAARASRAPHQGRATTERRPAAAEARQASSSSHARVEHRQSIRELFPAIHQPAHHIKQDAEPLACRSPTEDARQSHPERLTSSAGKAGRQEEEPSRPSEDDANGRPSRRRDQGDARHTTTREDRARRPSNTERPQAEERQQSQQLKKRPTAQEDSRPKEARSAAR